MDQCSLSLSLLLLFHRLSLSTTLLSLYRPFTDFHQRPPLSLCRPSPLSNAPRHNPTAPNPTTTTSIYHYNTTLCSLLLEVDVTQQCPIPACSYILYISLTLLVVARTKGYRQVEPDEPTGQRRPNTRYARDATAAESWWMQLIERIYTVYKMGIKASASVGF